MTNRIEPALILESVSVTRGPRRHVRAVVSISGYKVIVEIVLDDHGNGVTLEQDPWLLYEQLIPHQLIIRTLSRIGRGDSLALPIDFGAEVRRMTPPFRLPGALAQEPNGIEDVDVKVLKFAREGVSPARVNANIRVDGRLLTIEAEVYAATGRPSAFRFFGKSVSDLTPRQYAALCRVVSRQLILSIERARERASRRRLRRQLSLHKTRRSQ